MPRLTPADLRFQIKRGLQTLSRSVLRDLAGKPDARERALDAATDTIAARFDGHDVIAPEVKVLDFADMDRPGRDVLHGNS